MDGINPSQIWTQNAVLRITKVDGDVVHGARVCGGEDEKPFKMLREDFELAFFPVPSVDPTNMDDTEQHVCRDIMERQQRGIAKYGVTVATNPLPLRDWLQHAYEECLDQAIYLRRAIQEIDEST